MISWPGARDQAPPPVAQLTFAGSATLPRKECGQRRTAQERSWNSGRHLAHICQITNHGEEWRKTRVFGWIQISSQHPPSRPLK
jgi:hypothetical protein